MVKKKILHIVPSFSAGGIESLVVALYENIDRQEFQFHVAAFSQGNPIHQEKLEALGAKIYFLADAGRKTSLFSKLSWRTKSVANCARIFFSEKIDVLHCHSYAFFGPFVLMAAMFGVPVRIVHAHPAGSLNESKAKKAFRRVWNFLNFSYLITHKIGASDRSAQWLFGKKQFEKGKTITIYNGIDLKKFSPPFQGQKQLIRKQLALKNGIHLAHVGRFTVAKNQSYLIDLFFETTLLKENTYLNLVGHGPLEGDIKKKVQDLGINDKVRFFDFNTDVALLLKAMDYFILPSLWEGLPVTALEAQATGIPVFVSNTVTREINIGLATFFPIDISPGQLAQIFVSEMQNSTKPSCVDPVKQEKFDIVYTTRQIAALYK